MTHTPVQDFINRMQPFKGGTRNPLVRDTYRALINQARKHQQTYGETELPVLIHYLDSLAEQVGLHPYAARIIRQQSKGLHERQAAEEQLQEAQQQLFGR